MEQPCHPMPSGLHLCIILHHAINKGRMSIFIIIRAPIRKRQQFNYEVDWLPFSFPWLKEGRRNNMLQELSLHAASS
jgi:hypothetical protein